MPCPRKSLASFLKPTTAKCPARRRTRGMFVSDVYSIDDVLTAWLVMASVCRRILWKKNEVADYEATTFSIFYNNTLFLLLVIVASFFLLKNFNPTV